MAKAIGADADAAKTVPVDAHEKFASMIVDYFRRGEAPTPILTTTFQRFARWLTRIYRALTRQGDLEGISPEVARIMDRMLATEDDLRAREINRRVDSAAMTTPICCGPVWPGGKSATSCAPRKRLWRI